MRHARVLHRNVRTSFGRVEAHALSASVAVVRVPHCKVAAARKSLWEELEKHVAMWPPGVL
eukprot:1829271-Pyramimonas_sp.AAC.1